MKITSPQLLDTMQRLLIVGRWLLVFAQTLESILLLSLVSSNHSEATWTVLALQTVYNALTLVIVHSIPISRLPVLSLIVIDLAFVFAASFVTGGSSSPFLGQCFLIIFFAAVFYKMLGGMLTAVASVAITLILVLYHPEGLLLDLRDLAPYFLIAGALTGYLVEKLETFFNRYQASEMARMEQGVANELANREIQMARSIQMAALPTADPDFSGLDITARIDFARDVGGDFYLYLNDDRRMIMAVGDVSGKGMPAAIVATSIVHLFHWLNPLEDPEVALQKLNKDLLENVPEESYATLSLAVYDKQTSEMQVWNAGHQPPLLWNASQTRVREIMAQNPALGMFEFWPGKSDKFLFLEGDILVLYTDGLTDARNVKGRLFEEVRVITYLSRNRAKSSADIADGLLKEAKEWGELTDDTTIMVCRKIQANKDYLISGN